MGVVGNVTINVSANYTETVPTGGLKLYAIPGATNTSQIFIKKIGSGANPILFAYSGGVATPTSSIQDGVWSFIGTDWVTVDGIDIFDPNTTNPSTMEFGYGFYNASPSDGCQYNTIKNCVITLKRINATAGAGLVTGGSRGIESVCASATAIVSSYTPTAASGTHSYNKFYSNLVQNCHQGIALVGYQSSSPYTLSDQQNDIGGTSAVTGNTVINFGGGTGTITAGIITRAQYSLNISYNYFNNNNGSGANPTNTLHAIYLGPANAASISVNSNTILLTAGTATINVYGVYSDALSNTLSINIQNNIFPASSFSNYGFQYMIYEASNSSYCNISGNIIKNIQSSSNGSTRAISASNSSICTISNNTIKNYTSLSSFNGVEAIKPINLIVTNNLIDSISAASVYGIRHTAATTAMTCNINLTNNVFRNIKINDAWIIYSSSTGATRSVVGNTIYSVETFSTNYLYSFSHGIDIVGGEAIITDNVVHSFTFLATAATATSDVFGGIICSYLQNSEISRNKIGSILNNRIGGTYGIYLNMCSDFSVHNNIIGDISAPKSILPDGLVGIWIEGGSNNHYVHYNTVYLNSPSTSTANFSSSAVKSATSGVLYLRNNILVNTSTSTGTGVTSAFSRSNSTSTLYSTSSNNNLFYAGTPSSSRVLYRDGTNSYSTLASLKAGVTPREAQSVTENPPFLTLNASSSNYLNLNTLISTQVESGAVPITGYTTDYAGTARNGTTPDIGAWEQVLTPADLVSPTITAIGFLTSPCNSSGLTLTASISDASGIATGSLSPRIYYRLNFGLYTSSQGSLTTGTYTNGIWTFTMSYNASIGDIVRYFFAFQDASSFANPTLAPPTGGTITNVNSVTTPPTTTYTFQVSNTPTITANSGTVCAGSNFSIVPSGGTNYSITGNSFLVNPTVTTTYSVTGTGTSGCTSSSPAVVTITVFAPPSISVNSGSICSGQIFTLSPSGALSYTYSSGSNTVNPSVSSSYSIIGSDNLGCVSINPAIANITVFTSPTIAANNGSICSGGVFTIAPTGANTFTISGGSTLVSPNSTTSYSIIGTSSAGCISTNTSVITVTVYPNPTISVASGTLCSGNSFTLSVTGANSYTFSSGTSIVSPTTTSTYSVIGTSTAGCLSNNTATAIVTVLSLPTLSITSSTPICSGQQATLTATGANSYTWSGNIQSSSVVITPTQSVTYSVSATGINGCSVSAQNSITVNALPTISVIASNYSVCSGNSTTLQALGSPVSFTWNNGTNGNIYIVSPTVSTNYSVTGSSTSGCQSSNTISITVLSAPSITASANYSAVCQGDSVKLSILGSPASYTWSSGIINNSPFTPTVSKTYSVKATGANGCVGSDSVHVLVKSLPSLTVNLDKDTVCIGEATSIYATGCTNYSWTPGNLNGDTIVVTPVTNTTYTVIGLGSNGCTNKASASIYTDACLSLEKIKNEVSINLYPNPNAGIFNLDITGNFAEYEIRIYNNLSQMVYKAEFTCESNLIDVHQLAKGLYVVKLYRQSKQESQIKLIID